MTTFPPALSFLVLAAGAFPGMSPSGEAAATPKPLLSACPGEPRLRQAYLSLPLVFELHQSQRHPEIKFVSRGSGYTLFLGSTEAMLALRTAPGDAPGRDRRWVSRTRVQDGEHSETHPTRTSVVRMKFLGADSAAEIV